jgi:hypothetical protein
MKMDQSNVLILDFFPLSLLIEATYLYYQYKYKEKIYHLVKNIKSWFMFFIKFASKSKASLSLFVVVVSSE